MTMRPQTAQATCLRAFAAALATSGVKEAVLSPGSRSAPLIIALGKSPDIRGHSVIDERAAGFFGLGVGKASGYPAVVACTSGTAAAELAPAVHEAREARTPVLVITADRPPESRAAGDNQTIDQIGVYGSAAKELDCPPFDEAHLAEWAKFAHAAVEATLHPHPGPVHINMPLWDPLAADPFPAGPEASLEAVSPFAGGPEQVVVLPEGRTVIVAGRDEFGIDGQVATAAETLGIPVIADPLSPLSQSTSSVVISNWESILRAREWSDHHRPDVIIRTGDLPTSKALRGWISQSAKSGAEVIHFDPLDSGRDPDGVNSLRVTATLQPSLTAAARGDEAWLTAWVTADAKAADSLEANAVAYGVKTEPGLVRELTASMGTESTLFVAASMPIRDVEAFGLLRRGPRVFANRGANGIDGTLATAAGHATANERATALLLGDVTFAYDVSSLSLLRDLGTPFMGIVLNNGGGAIFEDLPVAGHDEVYAQFVFTPPRLNIKAACEAWGVGYRSIASAAEIGPLWNEALTTAGPLIVEFEFSKTESRSAREALRQSVAEDLTNQ